jgi:tripartite-type tricarboxylate transporter receptor subunit TctC
LTVFNKINKLIAIGSGRSGVLAAPVDHEAMHLARRRVILKTSFKIMSTLALVTAIAMSSTSAFAQYPERTITIVVPFAAGGVTDLSARVYAEHMSKELGQPVIVDNKPGAGGTTGGGLVSAAAPDGYTLLWSGASLLAMAPLIYKDLSYDITTSFEPISRFMAHPNLFVINAQVPVNNIEEFIKYGRDNPEKLNYGSSGVGAVHHLSGELFKSQAQFEMQHIPYQGNGPAMTDLLAGNIDAMFIAFPQALPYAEDPSLKFLYITSKEESDKFPGAPTAAAVGFPGMEVSASWYGVLGPKGLSEDVLKTLSEATQKIAIDPDVLKFAEESGLTTIVEDPASFAEAIAVDTKAWADLVETTGLDLTQ